MRIEQLCLVLVLAPLVGALLSGFFRQQLGRAGSHTVTILGVFISFILSITVLYAVINGDVINTILYTWGDGSDFFPYVFHLGFLIDPLSAVMMLIVTFVSLLVHIYSIGYMADDPGYQRFFSYISLFTFMMLMLVTANNFLQLFFGWEGVGLVSYLLIGFWYDRESALEGSLKAFLVNRVGDLAFVLGIGLILAYAGTLDYAGLFQKATIISNETLTLTAHHSYSALAVICLLLFIGAMAKSAQVPLHVWLPESMEGPTPISALIHAATMVTAGVFMVARMSPLFEYTPTILSFILVIGATSALFTGLIGLVMTDIKRVVAYSTLSQLGYMMVAMGASAYSAGIFHLLTHACFKALLFLGAGSVIIGMHHEQDMRKMGGLWRKMPLTYVTFIIGTLALCAIPPFAGFYSKDTIIEAAGLSHIPGAYYAYYCVLLGAMVTALYSFRALFMTFHGAPRMDEDTWSHVKESPFSIVFPLMVLAIPSIMIGYVLYHPILFEKGGLLARSLFVLPEHNVLDILAEEARSSFATAIEGFQSMTFLLTVVGAFIAWICYVWQPWIPSWFVRMFALPYNILIKKYGFDAFNQCVFVSGTKKLGSFFYRVGDRSIIDGLLVDGTGNTVRWIASKSRRIQSGYLYHYANIMVLGLLGFLCWLLLG